jgi:diaminopimelate epimerase
MLIEFYKYQGTGNDFIVINNFTGEYKEPSTGLIQKMCDRKFGIGADGLMFIEKSSVADFKLTFFNPDGSESFCGNGSRCAVKFVCDVHLIHKTEMSFEAFDGVHQAKIKVDTVSITMRDVNEVEQDVNGIFINTGSPHLVIVKDNVDEVKIMEEGSKLRYNKIYEPIGTNVNFLQVVDAGIKIRTYEKGVENETLSCGTGVTAAALVYASLYKTNSNVNVMTKGGKLNVSFAQNNNSFTNVKLEGPAEFVFKGFYNE